MSRRYWIGTSGWVYPHRTSPTCASTAATRSTAVATPTDSSPEWAGRLRALPEDVREVYVYFNNDAFGYAIENAVTLRGILREAGESAE